MNRVLLVRWLFFGGFVFLVCVGIWAILVVTRMQRKQAVAITMLEFLAAKAGLPKVPLDDAPPEDHDVTTP